MTLLGKRVLITGSQGFTGRYMAAEMKSVGCHVLGLGSMPSFASDYFQVDLTDRAALTMLLAKLKPEIVIHLAALAFVGHGDPNAFYHVNLQGTRNLLEALDASEKPPEAILLASSANVYGNASSGILSEVVSPAPANDYAVSKLAMEYMAKLWFNKLPIIITRPFNYTGVGQTENFLLPKIVAHFKASADSIQLGNLDVARDFSDVRSVVNAYRRLIEAKAFGRTVNVCSGKATSLLQIIESCKVLSGHELSVTVNPAFVRQNEVKTLCGDAGLLKSLIGDWSSLSLDETMQWMLAN